MMKDDSKQTRFARVWDAIEPSPEEAQHMKLRAALMRALLAEIKAQGWTQVTAARKLGVTQPRISDLKRGKIDLFALDSLVSMLATIGLQVEFSIARAA